MLDQLDDERRAVFVLAELEGMTAQEIAAGLGLNVNTVYSRLRAARQQLERALPAAARTEVR
ncbi:RNA polymerase sigma factor [Nannocystis pusilla]|uniref:RNA polymerase sigma factor n=1 Tax=Nannocystis pusilla TaxID=889268 RepID=UPI003DA57BB9